MPSTGLDSYSFLPQKRKRYFSYINHSKSNRWKFPVAVFPPAGMLLAFFVYQGNIPRFFQTNLLYSQKKKYRIFKGKVTSNSVVEERQTKTEKNSSSGLINWTEQKGLRLLDGRQKLLFCVNGKWGLERAVHMMLCCSPNWDLQICQIFQISTLIISSRHVYYDF